MLKRRDILRLLPMGMAAGLLPKLAFAAQPEVFNTDGVAIHGYDPVSYFTDGMPVDGNDAHRLMWQGVTWRFSSAENLASFEAEPEVFAPQYGGYCAFAMSKGAVATSVPEAWTIYEDRLYLNFSLGVRDIWRQDIPGNVALADGHWPAALG